MGETQTLVENKSKIDYAFIVLIQIVKTLVLFIVEVHQDMLVNHHQHATYLILELPILVKHGCATPTKVSNVEVAFKVA